MKYKRGPVSLLLLVIFFGSGALICFITMLGLAFPGGFLEPIWQLHPDAKIEFQKLGHWSIALMAAVCAACGLARKPNGATASPSGFSS
jgi:hypothetical protein